MTDADVYARQNFGNRLGFGVKPALIVVDFVNGFIDPDVFGGGNIPAALEATLPVLARARTAGWPIAFTRIVYADDGSDAGIFCEKVPGLKALTEAAPNSQLAPVLDVRPGELIVRKTQASAFFGTGLAPWLTGHGVDTVVIAGCTTSGCVRATVVDACSLNFRPVVLTDCCGDRALAPHEANLFDIGHKYGDLVRSGEVLNQTWS